VEDKDDIDGVAVSVGVVTSGADLLGEVAGGGVVVADV